MIELESQEKKLTCADCGLFRGNSCGAYKIFAPTFPTDPVGDCDDFRPKKHRIETHQNSHTITPEVYEEFWRIGKDGKLHFQPGLFADYLTNKYYFKTMTDDKTIYVYNELDGIYHANGETLLQQEMIQLLGQEARKHHYQDIEFHIQGKTFFERPKKPTSKIACPNGLLNVQTCSLESFTPDEFVTIRIPVLFDPSAKCPKTLEFLEDVVGKNQMPIIQEALGYCFLLDLPHHKAFMFKGGGANGKSTYFNLQIRLLGRENVSNLTLQEICSDRFAPITLYNKLANICADLPDKNLSQTGMFKQLTGNDTIAARQLYRPYITFKNHAKMFFSTNKVPQTSDDTAAFFRRWIIISCQNMFTGENCDPNILEKIATPTELSGLLNWALEGLQRLIKNGEFTNVHSINEQRGQYIRQSNTAQAYIEETLEFGLEPSDDIVETELYTAYLKWCIENQLPSKKKGEFTQILKQVLPGVEQTTKREKDKTIHVYRYVKFKNVSDVSTPSAKFHKENSQNKLVRAPVTPDTKCPHCKEALPSDGKNTTVFEGKTVHEHCYLDFKEGKKKRD